MKEVNTSAVDLLAHKPPMRLIDTLVAVSETAAKAETKIRADNIFLNNNFMEESGLIECMAQTIASYWGFMDRESGKGARIGYLVGIDKTLFWDRQVQVGDSIEINIEEIGATGDFGAFQCQVTKAGEPICEGIVKVLSERSS